MTNFQPSQSQLSSIQYNIQQQIIMAYRKSQEKYSSAKPLRQLPYQQLLNIKPEERSTQLFKYESKIQADDIIQLKRRCAKIDQIQNYTNIIVESMENYKKRNEDLLKSVDQLSRENQRLRAQIKSSQNYRVLREETSKNDSELIALRKKNEITINLQSLKLQQQIVNQKHIYERKLGQMQSKYKNDIFRLENQLKSTQQKLENELLISKNRNQTIAKENAILNTRLSEAENLVLGLANVEENLSLELKKYQVMTVQLEHQLAQCHKRMAGMKSQASQTVAELKFQLNHINCQYQSSLSVQSMLQKMNAQLKNQGAYLISQNNEIKTRSLQVEEKHLINLRTMDNMKQDINNLRDSNKYLENKIFQVQSQNKQLIGVLEIDNITLRKKAQAMEIDISTKQKEIQDLIAIVARLEDDVKLAASTAMSLEQANYALNNQIKEATSYKTEVDTRKLQLQQSESKIIQLQKSYKNVKINFDELEQIYHLEKNRVRQLQRLLQLQKFKLSEIQIFNQRLINQSQERQRITQNWKGGMDQFEKMYQKEKQQNSSLKMKMYNLQQYIFQLESRFKQFENKKQLQSRQLQIANEEQKRQLIREGMEQIEKLVQERYSEVLKQYKGHFTDKIKQLEQEIILLEGQYQQAAK